MTKSSLQETLLQKIRSGEIGNEDRIHEMAEVLGMSTDSIYRRLRGETLLNIEEIEFDDIGENRLSALKNSKSLKSSNIEPDFQHLSSVQKHR